MKKSINIEKIFLEADFYDRFSLVKQAGFDHAEFWTWAAKDVNRIFECCQEAGVQISCFSGDQDYSLIIEEDRAAYLDYLEQSLEIACLLDAPYLVIHSNGMCGPKLLNDGAGIGQFKKIASMAKTLEQAAKLAEAYNKTLVLEALNTITIPGYFLTRTADSGDLCRVVDSPSLKVLYDIWHMQLMEGNILSTLTEYIDVIGYIHVGDAPGRNEPGTGEINFTAVKETLHDLGYDGFYGFELVPLESSLAACEVIRGF